MGMEKITIECNYENGLKHGTEKTYDPDGTVKWIRIFEKGIVKSRSSNK